MLNLIEPGVDFTYTCGVCNTMFVTKKYLDHDNPQLVRDECPICKSDTQIPTIKLTDEEIQLKKNQIKERLKPQ